jgi:hypothetical protein
MIITFEDQDAGLKAVNLDLCFAYNLYEDEKAIYFFRTVDDTAGLVGVGYWNDDLKFLRKLFNNLIEEQANGRKLFDITEYYMKYLKEGKNETLEYIRELILTRIESLKTQKERIDIQIKELEYIYNFLGDMIKEESKEDLNE